MNLLVEVDIKLHTEFGRVWLKFFFFFLYFFWGVGGVGRGEGAGSCWCKKFFLEWFQNQMLKIWVIIIIYLFIFFWGGDIVIFKKQLFVFYGYFLKFLL